jgi:hypothetical protein
VSADAPRADRGSEWKCTRCGFTEWSTRFPWDCPRCPGEPKTDGRDVVKGSALRDVLKGDDLGREGVVPDTTIWVYGEDGSFSALLIEEITYMAWKPDDYEVVDQRGLVVFLRNHPSVQCYPNVPQATAIEMMRSWKRVLARKGRIR